MSWAEQRISPSADNRPTFPFDATAQFPQAEILGTLNRQGYGIITGIPVAHAVTDEQRTAVSEDLLERLSFLGTPLPQGKDRIRTWFVRNEGETSASAREKGILGGRASKSVSDLGFHNDRAPYWHGHDIKTVGLMVFAQAPEGGETTLVDAQRAYSLLLAENPEAAATLRGAPFYFPRTTGHERGQLPYSEGPIIEFDKEQGFGVRYSPKIDKSYASITGTEMPQALGHALAAWEGVLGREELHQTFTLQPGETLLLNERRMLHARTEFTDDPANPRTLVRMWWGAPFALN